MNRISLDAPGCDLTSCLRSLSRGLAGRAAGMERDGSHVALVVCTQGLPTDENGKRGPERVREFREELAAFAKLPVRVVVRLCTDDEFTLRDVFHALDSMSDSIDVLDDYWGEVSRNFCASSSLREIPDFALCEKYICACLSSHTPLSSCHAIPLGFHRQCCARGGRRKRFTSTIRG